MPTEPTAPAIPAAVLPVVPPVVVVVGSLHHDIMVDAPDRPRKGETVTGSAWRPKFGGKGGNQAVAAAAAGALVRMAGAVGDDGFGAYLLDHLDAGGVDRAHVRVVPGAGSGMSVAISDSEGDYGAVIVSGANLEIATGDIAAAALWQDARALILQNEVPDAANIAAARAAKAVGAIVCLNAAPARALPEVLSGLIDVLVVNAIEAGMLGDVEVRDLASAAAAAGAFSERFPVAVVTAGGDGVAGALRHAPPVALPALPVALVSTHGAGDTFVGTLVTALADGLALGDALGLANAAAARHVSRVSPTG